MAICCKYLRLANKFYDFNVNHWDITSYAMDPLKVEKERSSRDAETDHQNEKSWAIQKVTIKEEPKIKSDGSDDAAEETFMPCQPFAEVIIKAEEFDPFDKNEENRLDSDVNIDEGSSTKTRPYTDDEDTSRSSKLYDEQGWPNSSKSPLKKKQGKRKGDPFDTDTSVEPAASVHPLAKFKTLLEEAEQKLAKGEWVLSKNPRGTKSTVWDTFRIVTEAASGAFKDCAQCGTCGQLKTYRLGQQTTNLIRHQKECSKKNMNNLVPGIAEIKTQLSTATVVVEEVSFNEMQEFKEACKDLCIGDLRPFSSVSGDNFRNVIQKAIDVGAKYGHVNASDIIADPTIMGTEVNQRAEHARGIVTSTIVKAIVERRCAATTDVWTNDFEKNRYMTVSLHFLNEDWELKNLILFTSIFPDESATGANIYSEIVSQFAKFNLSEKDVRLNLVWVNDGGEDVGKALETCIRLPCFAHALDAILKHTFTVKLGEFNFVGEKGDLFFDSVDDLVSFLKSSKLDRELSCALKTFKISTSSAKSKRYKSRVPLLETLLRNYSEVRDLLGKHGEIARLAMISVSDLGDLINFLKLIEAQAEVDDNLPGPSFHYFNKIAIKSDTDSDFMSAIRTHFREQLGVLAGTSLITSCKALIAYLERNSHISRLTDTVKQQGETRWKSNVAMLRSVRDHLGEWKELLRSDGELCRISDIDKVRVDELIEFLEPFEKETDRLQSENAPTLPFVLLSYKSLLRHCAPRSSDGMMIASLRERAYGLLHEKVQTRDEYKLATYLHPDFRLLRMLSLDERNKVYQLAEDLCDRIDIPVPKMERPPEPKVRKIDDDFDAWRDDAKTILETAKYLADGKLRDQTSLLSFWKSQVGQYPKLSQLAQKYLCIPATCASSKQIFNAAGLNISARRSSLSPQNLNDVLFLFSFLKFSAST